MIVGDLVVDCSADGSWSSGSWSCSSAADDSWWSRDLEVVVLQMIVDDHLTLVVGSSADASWWSRDAGSGSSADASWWSRDLVVVVLQMISLCSCVPSWRPEPRELKGTDSSTGTQSLPDTSLRHPR